MPRSSRTSAASTDSYRQSRSVADVAAAAATDTAPACRRRGSVGLPSQGMPTREQSRNPFYKAASNPQGTTTQLYFQAKYYGPCPEIPTVEDSPQLHNVLDLMSAKKANGDVVKCNLFFSEKGVAVGDRKSNRKVIAWETKHLASCATIKHPNSKTRRIGLFKVRDPATRTTTWHLFKYYYNKVDNMSDCFRFIVDCSLRDIGRAYAAQLAFEQAEAAAAGDLPQVADAWPEDEVVPPSYDMAAMWASEAPPPFPAASSSAAPARRRLEFAEPDESDAAAEVADLEASADRVPVYSRSSASDDGIDCPGYLEVSTR